MKDIKTKSGAGRQRGFEVVSAYAEKGVDSTDIVDGASYAFTATKG